MTDEIQTQPPQTVQPKQNGWKVAFMALLGICVIATVYYAGTQIGTVQQQPFPLNKTHSEEDKKFDAEVPEKKTENTNIFYVEDNALLSYDLTTKQKKTWIPKPIGTTDFVSYKGLRLLDDTTLGFGRCNIKTGDFGCALYLLDLTNGQETKVKGFDAKTLLDSLDFLSPKTYAYLTTTDTAWQLFVTEDGTVSTLEDLPQSLGGRGGFLEDANMMRFSPNGKSLMHISTASPRNITDFTVHIYDLASGKNQVVENATQPSWLDDTHIVYRNYSGSGSDGLYVYDVSAKTSTKIQGSTKSSYHPEVLKGTRNVISYEYDTKEVRIYDLEKRTQTTVATQALSGFWVTPTLVSYTKTQPCSDECMGPIDYTPVSLVAYDLSSQTESASLPINASSF
ncbi:MAG TPA: hypothetical protein VJ179_00790, partial [Patescibacteria group bacterium]|nr:hypothetical protein [Patescibacteria group bacterium]